MYNRLRFKIILILVIFIFSVMAVVGLILLNNVFSFYTDLFVEQMNDCFSSQLGDRLKTALSSEGYVTEINDVLTAFSGPLGIDVNREFFVLDENGSVLASSSGTESVKKTANLLSAMNRKSASRQLLGDEVMDYALYLSLDEDGEGETERACIIYVADNKSEMHQFTWKVFSIIMQALLIGLVIAVILSFFLAKAITSPILDITDGAAKLAEGDFSERLPVHSQDEIGVLTETFNTMAGELKRTLDEVSGEREKLETIFAYLNDGVVAFDSTGDLMHINQTAKQLLGISHPELMTFKRFISLLKLSLPADYFTDVSAGSITIREIEQNDSIIDLSVGKFSIELDNKPYGGIICVVHDVSEHFMLEKSRREFIATVSHELRTPLTGIRGATETVLENPDMDDETKNHFLGMVIHESDRMTRIVRDLLTLSRLDNKKMIWNMSVFSVERLLESCVEMLKIEAGHRNQTLEIGKCDRDIPDIKADRERIEQVIINIVQNAIKYTPDGGKITAGVFYRRFDDIEGLPPEKYTLIMVNDNGIGIPEEDIPHLFDRFYRVEKARSSETGGTGLGLAIADEIIRAHGGLIKIESVLNEGTTVFVFLP